MAWDEAQYVISKLSKKIEEQGGGSGGGSGIAPKAMAACSAVAGNAQAVLSWELPADTVLDGETIVEVKGVMIRRKAGEAPVNTTDGTLVLTSTDQTGTYTDEGLINDTTYYYRFFPYSTDNVYNMSTSNIVECTPTEVTIKVWGFHQNFSDTNPATCITYPSDVENASYAKMVTNEGTGTATAGSWGSFLTDVLKNLPYMVKADGSSDYQLNPADYTKKADGTTSDYNNSSYSGAGAFAWLNKIYMKEVYASDGNSRDVYFADGPLDGYTAVGFIDGDGNELEGVWIPMFYLNGSNNKTIAGQTVSKSLTTAQQKTKIDAVGTRARFFGGPIINVLRDLEYMLFKSTDIQLQAGHGNCNGGSESALKNNPVVANGNVVGWKGTNDKKTANKYFHSMVLGTYDQWLRDPYTLLVNGVLKYSDDYEYDVTGAAYDTASDTSWTLNGGWHYGSHLVKISDAFGSTPKKENTCSTTTGLCDGLNCNTSGVRVALRLGYCGYGLADGPAALNLDGEASVASWNCGAAVLLLPAKGYSPAA